MRHAHRAILLPIVGIAGIQRHRLAQRLHGFGILLGVDVDYRQVVVGPGLQLVVVEQRQRLLEVLLRIIVVVTLQGDAAQLSHRVAVVGVEVDSLLEVLDSQVEVTVGERLKSAVTVLNGGLCLHRCGSEQCHNEKRENV